MRHPLLARPVGRARRGLGAFLRTESAGGVVLLAATIAALTWANSPWSDAYRDLWETQLRVGFGRLSISADLLHWVNEGLMAVFFLVAGLELKRELVDGDLRDPRTAALPVLAALGGMALPALLYLAVTGSGEAARGWAIPMATDIAFVLGVLALLGRRAPAGLKLFLLTLAIVDDLGAIAVIAVFYSDGARVGWLAAAGLTVIAVFVVGRIGHSGRLRFGSLQVFGPLALVVWVCTYQSGVHATVAGVALGLATPTGDVGGRRPLDDLERRLHPVSSFVIVPLFALGNAGVALGPQAVTDAAGGRVAWAVLVGLVVGKTVGISGFALIAARFGMGRLPPGVRAGHVFGAALLAGMGFTVSLFVADLSFAAPQLVDEAKVGILAASLAAGAGGAAVLLALPGRRTPRTLVGDPAIGGE